MSAKKEKAPPTFQELILANLRKRAPRGEDAGIYEVSSTDDEVLSKIQYVLTTGNPAFDEIVGGMPFGRIVEIYGLEGCGKTALAIRCAARAERGFVSEIIRDKEGNVTYRPLEPDEFEMGLVYIDNERSLDDDRKLIVDGHRVKTGLAYCDTVDKLFKQIDDSILTVEAVEKSAEGRKKLHFVVIIVDTIASTSNKQELAQAWGKIDFNRAPQQYSQGFRKIISKVNSHNVCLICTNQVRVNFKAAQQAQQMGRQLSGTSSFEYTSYGGYALRFYATHRIFMHAHQAKYKLVPTAQWPAGIVVGFHSVKNRIKMPMRDGKMVLLFDSKQGGLHPLFSMLETLVLLRAIEIKAKEKMTGFICKFDTFGISVTTFSAEDTETTLDDDDNKPAKRRGSREKRELGFKYRADWPAFYAQHQTDCDALWTAAVNGAFLTDGLDGQVVEEPEDELLGHPALPELEE